MRKGRLYLIYLLLIFCLSCASYRIPKHHPPRCDINIKPQILPSKLEKAVPQPSQQNKAEKKAIVASRLSQKSTVFPTSKKEQSKIIPPRLDTKMVLQQTQTKEKPPHPLKVKKTTLSNVSNKPPSLPSPSTPSPLSSAVPIIINKQVQAYINFYTKNPSGRVHFQRTLKRAQEYQTFMERILVKMGLPKEVFYLAFIESGFDNHAYSASHACGPWQFIASTARRYGLKIDYWVDERRDPELATKAAARYLSDLYNQFQDWYLAAAAYNAGDGIIARAIKKCKTKNFWKLVKRARIKRETKYYVPKWLATIIIAKNPKKYGFSDPPSLPWTYEKVETPGLVDISYLAQKTHIKLSKLRHLNPALKTVFSPPYPYFLRVPREKKDIVIAYLQEQEEIREVFSHFRTYCVKSGDSLWKIAKRFRKNINFIAKLNNLSYPYLIHPGQKLIIPYGEPQKQVYTERDKKTGRLQVVYTVKSGDSLWKIAKRFNICVERLKQINKISGILHPGDQLIIPLPTQLIIYEVKRGDTLWDIARKFKTTPRRIMILNELSSPIIKPGDKLKIRISG